MIIEIIKLIFMAAICALASVTDIKKGIVPNEVMLISFCIGTVLTVINAFSDGGIEIAYFINIIGAFGFSLLLWLLKVWAGGDVKLMCVLFLFVPNRLFSCFPDNYFVFLIPVALTFAAGYIYLIFETVAFMLGKKERNSDLHLGKKIKTACVDWLCCVVYVTLLSVLLRHYFDSKTDRLSVYIIVINVCVSLLVSKINFLKNKYLVAAIFALNIVAKLVLGERIFDRLLIIIYAVVLAMISLRIMTDEYNYETIKTKDVKKGMILSTATTLQFVNSRVKGLPSQSSENLSSRLTEEEAAAVIKWENSKYGSPVVQTVRKMPFAIFVSVGMLLFATLAEVLV